MVGSTVAASGAGAAADATAGSDRLRWELIPAVREALAGVIAAPMDPASALEAVAPRAATRFQIVVAVFSMLDQSKPPSPAALQPAKVTVPHNSTSANCRRLPIARLPPFGYRKVRRTAPAHDRSIVTSQLPQARQERRGSSFFKNVLPKYNRWRTRPPSGCRFRRKSQRPP